MTEKERLIFRIISHQLDDIERVLKNEFFYPLNREYCKGERDILQSIKGLFNYRKSELRELLKFWED